MARKGNAVELTPDELAKAQAAELLKLEDQKKALEEQIDSLKEELKAYVSQTGNTDLGAYTVTKSEAKPKLNFGELTPNAQKRLLEVLMHELPEYVKSKTELDVERLYFAQSSAPVVANTLKAHGLSFDLVSSLVFRKAK